MKKKEKNWTEIRPQLLGCKRRLKNGKKWKMNRFSVVLFYSKYFNMIIMNYPIKNNYIECKEKKVNFVLLFASKVFQYVAILKMETNLLKTVICCVPNKWNKKYIFLFMIKSKTNRSYLDQHTLILDYSHLFLFLFYFWVGVVNLKLANNYFRINFKIRENGHFWIEKWWI